jgi:hypothetical protein
MVGVRRADWTRIRRNVELLGDPLTERSTTWAATALGIAVGIGGIAIGLMASDSDVKPGFIPALLVAAIAALVFAGCFTAIGRTEKKRRGLDVTSVCADMDDVLHHAMPSSTDARS